MLSFMKNCSTQAMLTQKAQEHLILDVTGIHKISGKFSIWSILQSNIYAFSVVQCLAPMHPVTNSLPLPCLFMQDE